MAASLDLFSSPLTVGFIGCGNMAEAIARGLLMKKSKAEEKDDVEIKVIASNPSEPRRKVLAALGATVTPDNQVVVDQSQIIFLCVKPQIAPLVLPHIKVKKDHILVSVMAGKSISWMKEQLGSENSCTIIRVMPNTPLLIGQGACAIAHESHVDPKIVNVIKSLLAPSSSVIEIVDETLMDAVTGVSGSGPAYVFRFLEALIEGGIQQGLSSEIATRLAIQTVIGAGKLAEHANKEKSGSPSELRARVTSKGGTTQAALEELEKHHYYDGIVKAVAAAADRGKQLSLL